MSGRVGKLEYIEGPPFGGLVLVFVALHVAGYVGIDYLYGFISFAMPLFLATSLCLMGAQASYALMTLVALACMVYGIMNDNGTFLMCSLIALVDARSRVMFIVSISISVYALMSGALLRTQAIGFLVFLIFWWTCRFWAPAGECGGYQDSTRQKPFAPVASELIAAIGCFCALVSEFLFLSDENIGRALGWYVGCTLLMLVAHVVRAKVVPASGSDR